jgi:hypothetical protein
MAPRKKNLNKRDTVKVPYATLYTHETAEGKPKAAPDEPTLAAETPDQPPAAKTTPGFAKKK